MKLFLYLELSSSVGQHNLQINPGQRLGLSGCVTGSVSYREIWEKVVKKNPVPES